MTMFDYLRNALVNASVRAVTFTSPTTLGFALVTSTPTVSQTGATIPEVSNSNAYARATLTANTSNFSASSSGATANAAAITFPTATGSWGTVVGVVVLDSGTYGAGNALFYAPLSTSKTPTTGDTPSIPISDLTFSLV